MTKEHTRENLSTLIMNLDLQIKQKEAELNSLISYRENVVRELKKMDVEEEMDLLKLIKESGITKEQLQAFIAANETK